jgi:hypothetical protein
MPKFRGFLTTRRFTVTVTHDCGEAAIHHLIAIQLVDLLGGHRARSKEQGSSLRERGNKGVKVTVGNQLQIVCYPKLSGTVAGVIAVFSNRPAVLREISAALSLL